MSAPEPSSVQIRTWLQGSPLLALCAWGASLLLMIVIGLNVTSVRAIVVVCGGVLATLLLAGFLMIHRNMARTMRGVQLVRAEIRAGQRTTEVAIMRSASVVDANKETVRQEVRKLRAIGAQSTEDVLTEIRALGRLVEVSTRRERVTPNDLAAIESAVFDLLFADLHRKSMGRAEELPQTRIDGEGLHEYS